MARQNNSRSAPVPAGDQAAYDLILDQISSGTKFSLSASPQELIRHLDILATIDAQFEKEKSFWMYWAIGFAFLSFFSIFLAAVTGGYSLIVTALLVAGLIFSIVKMQIAAGKDVEDRRHLIPRMLLMAIATDMPPTAKTGIAIDFNSPLSPEFKTATEGGGFFSSVKTSKFRQPWLAMSGQFMDGNRFRLRVAADVKEKRKSKRKGTKVTQTFSDRYSIAIDVNPARFAGFERLATGGGTASPASAAAKAASRAVAGQGAAIKYRVQGNRIIASSSGGGYRTQSYRGSTHGSPNNNARHILSFLREVYADLLTCGVKA